MCYEDNGLVVGLHVPKHGKELVCLLRREDCRRLIQNENLGTSVEDLYDFDGLLLGDRHIVDLLLWVYVESVAVADLLDLLVYGSKIHLSIVKTKDYVLSRRKDIDQVVMLVDHPNAKVECIPWRPYGHRFAVLEYLSTIGLIDTGKHVHKRRLSAAVLTKQTQYLTPVYGQIDVIVGHDLTKGFGYAFEFYCTLALHFLHCCVPEELWLFPPFPLCED